MKATCAVLLLLALAPCSHADPLLYRSNSFGMLLEPIQRFRRDQTEWVVEVEKNGANETRRLYDNGTETHRWETTALRKDGGRIERELAGSTLVAVRTYDAAGSVLQEEQFTGGALSQRAVYSYAGGRLLRVRVQNADGSLSYTEDYLYTTTGALRQVRRTPATGDANLAAYTYGSQGLSVTRTTVGAVTNLDRYDSRGRVVQRERSVDGSPVSREDFTFRPDADYLLSSVEVFPADSRRIDRGYDEKGHLTGETTTVAGKVTDTVLYARDGEGRVTMETRHGPNGLEVWKYTLDDAGKVTRETYAVGGTLAKVTVYGADKLRTEDLYREGEMFLRVFYDGDTRLREQVFVDGAMVRERHY